jgi:hypothetical protein
MTSGRPLALSWNKWPPLGPILNQINQAHGLVTVFLKSILILSSYLRLLLNKKAVRPGPHWTDETETNEKLSVLWQICNTSAAFMKHFCKFAVWPWQMFVFLLCSSFCFSSVFFCFISVSVVFCFCFFSFCFVPLSDSVLFCSSFCFFSVSFLFLFCFVSVFYLSVSFLFCPCFCSVLFLFYFCFCSVFFCFFCFRFFSFCFVPLSVFVFPFLFLFYFVTVLFLFCFFSVL